MGALRLTNSGRTGFTKEEMDKFPNVLKWIDRIAARPAVQRGIGDAYVQK